MKLFVYILMTFIAQLTFGQRTFYVSNAGSDSNNGLSQATPFQTISKVNSIALQPGDNVFFRRGDTFRDRLTILNSGTVNSPIRIDAYGTGNKPVISGSTPVSGWVNIGGNVWQANCSSCGSVVNGLYQNNSALPLGRYPNLNAANRGYQTIQSHTGKTSLVSQQALTTNWVGGEVVYRPTLWILNRATITQQSGNTLTLNNTTGYDLSDGWGYFIQNHPGTLDQDGEWCFNSSNKTFQLFSSQNPNNQQISATVNSLGVYMDNTSYVIVQNLQITQTLDIGLSGYNISNCTLSNLEITNSGTNGMVIQGSGNTVTIENNLIDQSNNNGVEINSYTNLIFRKNIVKRIGLVPGRGKSDDSQYLGMAVNVNTNMLIENNIIDNIGYNGISFSAQTNGLTIRKNIISNFLLIKNDGGGIYTFNGSQLPESNIKIQSNIVYNGFGSPEGAILGPTFSGVNGIYLDGCTKNVEVSTNTVFNCTGVGVFMIAVSNNNISGNTLFDNKESQLVLTSGNSCPPRSNTVTSNVMVSKVPTQTVARYEASGATDLGQYGLIDGNYYVRPLDDAIKINAAFLDVNVNSSNAFGLKDWQRLYSKDLNAKGSPITYKGFTINSLVGATRIGNGTFSSDISEWYTQSYYSNGKLEWDNTNRLDGGSMRMYFQPSSGYKASYMIAYHDIGVITSGKNYVLRFDAIASIEGKTLQAYMRTRNGSQELATRIGSVVGTTRKHYELAFTANTTDTDALIIFQTLEDGESVWLDNISFQEANITRVNADDLIKLYYNPHVNDTTINISGTYRDARGQFYSQQLVLSPFTSVVLLKNVNPDLTPTIVLPQANFAVSGVNANRDFALSLFEVNGFPTSSGNAVITITAPVGYSLSYNNTLTNINVSGGTTVPVENTRWSVTNMVSSRQLTLTANAGQFINAGGQATLGFTISRTTANSGSTSSLTVSVNDDINQTYDAYSSNNVYARILSGL